MPSGLDTARARFGSGSRADGAELLHKIRRYCTRFLEQKGKKEQEKKRIKHLILRGRKVMLSL